MEHREVKSAQRPNRVRFPAPTWCWLRRLLDLSNQFDASARFTDC
jgi:hypothetical protein